MGEDHANRQHKMESGDDLMQSKFPLYHFHFEWQCHDQMHSDTATFISLSESKS